MFFISRTVLAAIWWIAGWLRTRYIGLVLSARTSISPVMFVDEPVSWNARTADST